MKMKQKYILLITLLFIITCLGLACKDDPPNTPVVQVVPEKKVDISLFAEDKALDEVWFKVLLSDSLPGNKIQIFRNNVLAIEFGITGKDTIVKISPVALGDVSNYQAVLLKDTAVKSKSTIVTHSVLDTTGHSITWNLYKIANYGFLYDIAVIDENTIWAVGDFYNDFNEPDYNLAIWNGSSWELKRIKFETNQDTIFGFLFNIYAINKNDVWLCGGWPIHWNGNKLKTIQLSYGFWNQRITEVWGTDSNNIYIGGDSGNIAHFNGKNWSKINTGCPDISFTSITGDKDGKNVWFVGNEGGYSNTALLNHSNNKTSKLYYGTTINGTYLACWTNRNDRVYVVKDFDLAIQYRTDKPELKIIIEIPEAPYAIDGNNINDLYGCGPDGYLFHFNGKSVIEYKTFNNRGLKLVNLSVKGNTVAVTGYDSYIMGTPYVVIGKK